MGEMEQRGGLLRQRLTWGVGVVFFGLLHHLKTI